MSPPVSLCIPTYNGAAYLRAALDSALAQSFRDFELLVVDDGSSDGTVAIVEEYARRDARVRLERNPERLGMAGNWNRCLQKAQGEWIKFLFQDDCLAPACLERMLAAVADRPGVALVACRREFAFEAGVSEELKNSFINYVTKHNLSRAFPGRAFIPAEAFADYMVRSPAASCIGEPTAVLLHRSVTERFGYFHPYLVQLIDFEYWARIAVHAGLAYVDEALATFRLHPQSATAGNKLARQYRADVIDPLVIGHELAYAPGYAPVRAAACRAVPPVNLRHRLLDAARQARELARRHAENAEQPDPGPWGEWEQAARNFPRLRSWPPDYLLALAGRKARAYLSKLTGGR